MSEDMAVTLARLEELTTTTPEGDPLDQPLRLFGYEVVATLLEHIRSLDEQIRQTGRAEACHLEEIAELRDAITAVRKRREEVDQEIARLRGVIDKISDTSWEKGGLATNFVSMHKSDPDRDWQAMLELMRYYRAEMERLHPPSSGNEPGNGRSE